MVGGAITDLLRKCPPTTTATRTWIQSPPRDSVNQPCPESRLSFSPPGSFWGVDQAKPPCKPLQSAKAPPSPPQYPCTSSAPNQTPPPSILPWPQTGPTWAGPQAHRILPRTRHYPPRRDTSPWAAPAGEHRKRTRLISASTSDRPTSRVRGSRRIAERTTWLAEEARRRRVRSRIRGRYQSCLRGCWWTWCYRGWA